MDLSWTTVPSDTPLTMVVRPAEEAGTAAWGRGEAISRCSNPGGYGRREGPEDKCRCGAQGELPSYI